MSGGISAATVLAASSLALGVYSTIQAGSDKKDLANDNAEMARRNAAQTQDAAVAQAEKIRKAAAIQKSQANAGLAASGVDLSSGSSVKINEEITKNSEQDAYTTILNGSRGAASSLQQASMFERSGRNAANASFLNAGSSLLSGGARIGSGWKTSAGGTADFKSGGQLIWGDS